MKKFIVFSVICFLSGFMLMACQRDEGVQAGYESDTYQPRPAPSSEAQDIDAANEEMKGELIRVDTSGKTIAVRLENGMVQTFTFDDTTAVEGLENQQQTKSTKTEKTANVQVRSLAGKEGSEVTIQWHDHAGAKMATHIEVTQLSTAKNRRSGR